MTIVSVKPSRIAQRIRALRVRHARLQSAIEAEEKRPSACSFKLQSLKRLRLKVKDEIQALKPSFGRRAFA